MKLFTLLLSCFIAFFACSKEQGKRKIVEPPKCGDFLKQFAQSPASLEYVGCELDSIESRLRANYRVKGSQSQVVEQFLVDKYGMGELKTTCCVWEPRNGQRGQIPNANFEQKGYGIMVHMGASCEREDSNEMFECLENRDNVEYFEVEVEVSKF